MNTPTVYLAGRIAGTEQGAAFNWRIYAAERFRDRGIETRSPMRAKMALSEGPIGSDFREYEHRGWAYTPDGILTRDHNDCVTSNGVLMNLLGLQEYDEKSFGSGMELAWTFHLHIPTVVVIEPEGNPHDRHPMFVGAVKFRLSDLDEAIDAMAIILNR